jgi:hypothetical protein
VLIRQNAGNLTAVVKRAIKVTRARFDEDDRVELGVGCESCHLGSREHVAESCHR